MHTKLPDETGQRLLGSRKSREKVRWKVSSAKSIRSSIDHLADSYRHTRSKVQKFSSKALEFGKTQWQTWVRLVCLHILPVVAALVIIMLNIKGYFIGKQLTGHINQDGTKMLALQITAKIHELLMLASLADILCTYLLHLLVFGDGAPFGALTAGQKFSSISYLWSEDFFAVCRAAFPRKAVIICLIIVCTILGVVVGPSSATAMAPREDIWNVGQVQLPLNISKGKLWPSTLDQTTLPEPLCSSQSQSCSTDGVWSSLSSNLFSFWGAPAYGGIQGMPEATSLNGADAMRMLHARFRGPINLYQPDFTVATVQPVFAANIVNGLRMLWFSNNDQRCSENQGGICDYQDINWSIDAMQPTVYVSCGLYDPAEGLEFSTMSKINGTDVASKVLIAMPVFNNTSQMAAEAIELQGDEFSRVSFGAILHVSSNDQNDTYTCSINAQWSQSTVATTFLGSPFMVDGSPPYFFIPLNEGSTYKGQTVHIEESWANAVLSTFDTVSNLTVLESLFTSGGSAGPEQASEKLESILSVLVAEGMARIKSNAQLNLRNPSEGLATLQWGELRIVNVISPDTQVITFQTRVTGYGYGISTGENIAVGVLLSVLILIIYCVIVVVHFITRFVQGGVVVHRWRKMFEILVLALHSPFDTGSTGSMHADSDDILLRENVRFVQKGDHVEMVLGQVTQKQVTAQDP